MDILDRTHVGLGPHHTYAAVGPRAPTAPVRRLLAVPAIAAVLGLAACAASQSPPTVLDGPTSTDTSTGPVVTPSAPALAANGCPLTTATAGNPAARARLAVDIGLTAGTFHRYVLGPSKKHRFDASARNRSSAVAQASQVLGVESTLLAHGVRRVLADPQLCSVFYDPMTQLQAVVARLGREIPAGTTSSVPKAEAIISHLLAKAPANGLQVKELIELNRASDG